MEFFKKNRIHFIALGIFILTNVIYFFPQTEGKKIEQSDISQYVGMSHEANEYNRSHDDVTLWTNSMFGGMPTYQIGAPQKNNISSFFQRLLQMFSARPIGYFISMMIGFYILMLCLRINPWIGIIGALAFAWSTNHFVLFEAGHTSKLEVIASLPVLTAGLVLLLRRMWLPGLTVYLIGMGINMYSNHIQMTYYFALTLVVLVAVELVKWIRASDWSTLVKTGAFVLIGSILAMGLSASKLLTTKEYSEDTMRGKPILENTGPLQGEEGTVSSSSTTEGLDWEYAMKWSNGTSDIIASLIPGFVGGSGSEYLKEGSDFDLYLRRLGVRPQKGEKKIQFGTYWGELPFTSGPSYFGAILVFLFVLGAFLVKDTLRWWIIGGVVMTVLLSYGKNFESLQRLFFDHVPLYNKFRTPNSIMSITAFLIPILAFMGLAAALDTRRTKDEVWRALKIAAGTTAGFSILMWLLGTQFFSFSSASDPRLLELFGNHPERERMYQELLDQLIAYRKQVMKSDALRSGVLILLSGGAIWAFINKKLKLNYAVLIIGGLVLIDMAGIGSRYLNHNSFTSGRISTDGYVMRQVDRDIIAAEPKGRGFYRVLDMSSQSDPFSSAFASYFHNTLNGYHAAKLQRIQDIIDHHLRDNNQKILNMFNVKYMIQSRQVEGQQGMVPFVAPIPEANGTAWFVRNVTRVGSPNQEIDSIGRTTGFDEKNDAVVLTSEFPKVQFKDTYSKEGTIELTSYAPNKLVYETSELEGEHMAIFPEVWYGPDKGWQAYVDDEPVEHFRANYILRGMVVPAGKHTIRFEFRPSSYYNGEKISLATSVLIVLLIMLNGYAIFRKPEWMGMKEGQVAQESE